MARRQREGLLIERMRRAVRKVYPNAILFKIREPQGQYQGMPDLLVIANKKTLLVEVKRGDVPPSKRRLRPSQIEMHRRIRLNGVEPFVVTCTEELLELIGSTQPCLG